MPRGGELSFQPVLCVHIPRNTAFFFLSECPRDGYGRKVDKFNWTFDKYFTWMCRIWDHILLSPMPISIRLGEIVMILISCLLEDGRYGSQIHLRILTIVWERHTRVFSFMGKIPGMMVKDKDHKCPPTLLSLQEVFSLPGTRIGVLLLPPNP